MSETIESTPFELARSPGHLLHRAQQRAEEIFATLLRDNHVTLRQFAVLAAVDERAGRTQTDLVRVTGIDRSTLADMMGRLEKKGLIAREKSADDKRAKSVRLTGKGRTRLAEAAPHAMAADAALLDALPRNKRRAFLGTLETLVAAIDAAAIEAESHAAKRSGKKPKKSKTEKAEEAKNRDRKKLKR
ncbi:MAG: MarR family transcriptional regulator [Hyphomonadaceae bacterium]|nr:MAG: MarR family transcriptional regulator [Caulobacteraceae bacterium]MBT9446164.1 MarR family transcriptional regulator [Hyphomonadaceae bacterium]TPW07151.1 MAG: MarR family transcriptional regulator [Alphaproteobacteria bacterium]